MRKIALLIPLCLIVAASTLISGCTTASTEAVTAHVEDLTTINVTGEIQVEFTLTGDDDAEVDLKIQYCEAIDYVDSGHDAPWYTATILEDSGDTSEADLDNVSPDNFTFYWNTVEDLPTATGSKGYILRVMPGLDTEDYSDVAGPINVDNGA